MSKTPEAQVRDPVVKHAKKIGVGHIRINMAPGTTRGYPDDVFLYANGHTLWIEFKREGGDATPLQSQRHFEMAERGQHVYVVDSTIMGKRILDSFERLWGVGGPPL